VRALTNHDDFEQAQANCHDDKHKVNWDHPTWFWSCSTTCSSVHLATPSVLQTTSGTDYVASSLPQSPLQSPPPVPGVVLSIRMPTTYMHLIRMLPEPELDDKGRPKPSSRQSSLQLAWHYSTISIFLKTRKRTRGRGREMYHLEKWKSWERWGKEHAQSSRWTGSLIHVPKLGRQKYKESTKNPLHAPTCTTPPVWFIREEDQFAKWLNEDMFWAGKRIPKVEFG